MPPEYEDEETDYALDEKDNTNMILDDMGLLNYDDVEAQLSRQDMTPTLRNNFFLKKQSHQRFRIQKKSIKRIQGSSI